MSLPDRFWAKVRKGVCWTWQASKTVDGYGRFKVDGEVRRAHVVAWEAQHGPVPAGHVLDHTCRRRHCCNPSHLQPVTVRDNTLRGKGPTARNARKVRCKRGHPLEGDNLIITHEADGTRRRCRTCYCARKRKAYAERRRSCPPK